MQNSSVTKIVNALRDIRKCGPCSGPGIAIKIIAEAGIDEPGEVTVAADHLGGGFPASSSITISIMANTAITACGGSGYRLPRQAGDADDVIAAEARSTAQIALSLPQLTAMISNFSCDRLHLEAADADTPLVRSKFGILMGCRWNFGQSEKLETEKRPAFARSGATPNMQ